MPSTTAARLAARLTEADLWKRVGEAADLRDGARVGIVAEPTGDWTAFALDVPGRLNVRHIATAPSEQIEAKRRITGHDRAETVVWEALALPSEPDPSGCRFDVLLCGVHVTRLDLAEFSAWARAAVVPGGRLICVVETFCGTPALQDHFTSYQRMRLMVAERRGDAGPPAFPTRDEIIDRLREAGFGRLLLRGLHPRGRLALSEFVLVSAQ